MPDITMEFTDHYFNTDLKVTTSDECIIINMLNNKMFDVDCTAVIPPAERDELIALLLNHKEKYA